MKKIIVLAVACLLLASTAFAEEAKEVARATFATGIENREPVESITEYVLVSGGTIFFFAELKNMQGTKASHVWSKNGEEVHAINFNVGGPRWRTNSSMKAEQFKAGDKVQVEVMGDDGKVYKTMMLNIL